MGQKHKHAELIKAWADGAEIEWRSHHDDAWHQVEDIMNIVRFDSIEYRIKPEQKPDVETMLCKKGHSWYELYPTGGFELMKGCELRIKLTFDGETGELKSAEVIS